MGDWAVPTLAVLLIAYGAFSARLMTTPVTQAMVFVSLGLLVGNRELHLVEVQRANHYVLFLAEATLALLLFSDAVRVDVRRLRREAAVPARLLGIGLPLTIVAGTAVALLLFADLDLWVAAALATILAPTDAALGQPVVSNPRLPSRIRQGLNVESGLNDGVCVPVLLIFLTLAEAGEGGADLEPVKVILEEIGYGALAGVAAGGLGAWALRSSDRRGWTTPVWTKINGVVTPLLAYTAAVALGGSGFIAAFVAGIVFAAVETELAEQSTSLAEQAGELLNATTFLLFGAVLLGPTLDVLDWRMAAYAVLSLTLCRMLPVALAMVGTGMRPFTVLFLGWFGPRGLASIVFGLLVLEETDLPERSQLLTVVTLTVALSVFLHGLTAWPGAHRYADWYAATAGRRSMPESEPVPERRLRADHWPSRGRATASPRGAPPIAPVRPDGGRGRDG
jgi:NhaP-type Na+/H+ or K+/H+ antiporter